jgi:uncharacterized protein
MSEENKSILKQANAAMAKGDIEGFLSYCAEDAEWTFVGDKTLRGKAAIREYIDETYAKPPNFDVSDMIAENDLVTAIGEITITSKGQKATSYWYCDVWRLHSGKLAQLRAFVVEKQ